MEKNVGYYKKKYENITDLNELLNTYLEKKDKELEVKVILTNMLKEIWSEELSDDDYLTLFNVVENATFVRILINKIKSVSVLIEFLNSSKCLEIYESYVMSRLNTLKLTDEDFCKLSKSRSFYARLVSIEHLSKEDLVDMLSKEKDERVSQKILRYLDIFELTQEEADKLLFCEMDNVRVKVIGKVSNNALINYLLSYKYFSNLHETLMEELKKRLESNNDKGMTPEQKLKLFLYSANEYIRKMVANYLTTSQLIDNIFFEENNSVCETMIKLLERW